jgi:Arc/MetJ-type ribon-helix-helix transcriptional regulator
MNVALTPEAAMWIEAEIAAGAFPSAEDAVEHAINELRIKALRASLDAAEAEGGSYSGEEVMRYVREHLESRDRSR